MKQKIVRKLISIFLPRGGGYRPDEVLEEGYQKIFIDTEHGQICVLFRKSNHQTVRNAIILSHPYLTDAKQFYLKNGFGDLYHHLGLDVYLFDFNGFGESDSRSFNYVDDLAYVAEYVRKNADNPKIFGHGISFGASHLINFSKQKDTSFDRIIVENCLNSNLNYYKKRNKRLYYMMKTFMFLFPSVNKDHDYTKGIADVRQTEAVLFIYNRGDELTTLEMGNQIMNNCKIPSQMEVFEGGHLEAFRKEPERYTNTIATFLGV